MAISVSWSGSTYTIPSPGDGPPNTPAWGNNLNTYLQAIAARAPALDATNSFASAQTMPSLSVTSAITASSVTTTTGAITTVNATTVNATTLNGALAPSSLTQGGATTGQWLAWSGTAWIPSSPVVPVAQGGTGLTTLGGLGVMAALTASSMVVIRTASTPYNAVFMAYANNGGVAFDQVHFSDLAGTATAAQVPALGSLNGSLGLGQIAQGGATAGQGLVWSGTAWAPSTLSAGTVTSVGLSLPADLTVTGSPITTSGTLTASWATQSANRIMAGPTSGIAAAPTWRALVAADIPSTLNGTTFAGNVTVSGTSTLTIGNTVFQTVGTGGQLLFAGPGGTTTNNLGFIFGNTTSTDSPTFAVNTSLGGTKGFTFGQNGSGVYAPLLAGVYYTLGPAGAPVLANGNAATYGYGFADSTHLTLYTAGTSALSIDASQNSVFGGNTTVPAGASVFWSSNTQLKSSANGVLQITNNANTAPTSLAAGITIGTGTAGAALVYDSTNGLRSMSADRSANNGFAGSKYFLTNADGTIRFGTAGYGIAIDGTANTIAIAANNVTAITFNSNQQMFGFKYLPVAKTANYTVNVLDTGTHFTNSGATGAVQFTLPAPASGLTFTFTCLAAQTMTVITANTGTQSIFQGSLTGGTRTASGGSTGLYASATYTCLDGTNWFCEASSGTWT